MQDRFKFRGQTKVNEWIYGSLLWYADEPQIWDKNGNNFIVKPVTVGQCTGLKDKNGKLIYEGDIVKYTSLKSKINPVREPYSENFKVVWSDTYTGYNLRDFKGVNCQNISVVQKQIEVIGNIYENPELLKGGEG